MHMNEITYQLNYLLTLKFYIMKQLFIAALLLTTICYSQKECYQYIAIGSDIKFCPHDLIFNAGLVGNNFEVNIGYENFNTINFDKYTIGVGYHLPLQLCDNKVVIIPSIEPTLINRWYNWGGGLGSINQVSSHLSLSGNLSVRAQLYGNFMAELQFNYLPRIDLNAMYGGTHYRLSNYFKVIYKL